MTMTNGELMGYIGAFMAWFEKQPVLSFFLGVSCVHLFIRVIGALMRPLRGGVDDFDDTYDEETDTDDGRYSFASYSATNHDAGYEYFNGD